MTSRLALTAAVGLALLAAPAVAQAPNPLDVIPPNMPFDIPYGTPISLAKAQAVIAAAVGECAKHNWKMNVAVVDSGGNLVAFSRMDGAQIASVVISQAKAKSAAEFRRETKVFESGMMAGNVYQLSLPGAIGSRGGIPLVEGGKLIGAIGSSGGAGAQDEVCSKAGAAVIK